MTEEEKRFRKFVDGTGAKPIGVFKTIDDVMSALTGGYRPGVVVAEAVLALILAGVIPLSK